MPKCFVIQPYNSSNTKLFDNEIVHAINAAGFEAVRADRNSGSQSSLVDQLLRYIRESTACLAEITENNPNVYYEVGYAVACNKPVILIRKKDKGSNPFNLKVNKTLFYETNSSADYEKLRKEIEEELKKVPLNSSPEIPEPPVSGYHSILKERLGDIEIKLLSLMMKGDTDTFSPMTYATVQRLLVSENGNTMMGVNLAIKELKRKGLIASFKWGGADALLITPAWDGWAKNHPEDLERITKEAGTL